MSNQTENTNQQQLFRIKYQSDSQFPIIYNISTTQQISWELLKDKSNNQISDSVLYLYISSLFLYNPTAQSLISLSDFNPISDIYKSSNINQYSRILYSDTNLPKNSDLAKSYISNFYYCTKESALFLGLFESLVRTNYNEILLKNVDNIISKSHQTKHFKEVYKLLWENPQANLLKLKFATKFMEYEIDNVFSMQKFANTFNLGVSVKNLNSDKGCESFTILPEDPKIIPVPIIQLGKFKQYVFCLYSDLVNELDGFDTKGNLSKSSEIEFVSEIFCVIENKDNSVDYIEIIEKLSQTLLESLKYSSDKTKINQMIESIETRMKSKNLNSKEFQKSSKLLSDAKFQLTKNSFILLDQDLSFTPTKNLNLSLLPKPLQSNNSKLIAPTPNNPNNPSSIISSLYNMKNPIAGPITNYNQRPIKPDIIYPQNPQQSFKPTQQNYIQNPIIAKPAIQKSYIPSVPGQQIGSNKGAKTTFSNQPQSLYSPYKPPSVAKLEKCIGCEKNKLCNVIHSNCRLCQGCIYNSLNQKTAKCIKCGMNIEGIRSDIASRISFICDKCKQKTRSFEVLECGCILCKQSCKGDNHVCPY